MIKTLFEAAAGLATMLAMLVLVPVLIGVDGLPLDMLILVAAVWILVSVALMWFQHRLKPRL